MSMSLESLMRQQLAAEPRNAVARQLLAFLLIGGTAALSFVALSTVAVATFDAMPSWLVSALCYAAFIVPVYLAHRRLAFRSAAGHAHALPRYVVVQICGLALAAAFSWVAYGVIGMPAVLAALVVIGLTSGINFIVLRLWAFGVA